MIYFDTSALIKLVVTEDETAPLEAWLDGHPEQPWATSDLTRVELLRGVMRRQPMALLQAQQLITRMVRVPLSDGILLYASTCQPPLLRSLDAIHLASVMEFRKEIDWMLVYDKRLLEVANLNGINVASPS
ncbi:type II toxin-antitoxin system VapC family toxin [Glycomyces rhizosphaerae]|uniref:Type II toxin-antitoxin system VapC family toxin n=1 Tax=Glycomyces rhizosphaerae TaxID=2054422 RepID=A0ABV7Q3C2_9ACTN